MDLALSIDEIEQLYLLPEQIQDDHDTLQLAVEQPPTTPICTCFW